MTTGGDRTVLVVGSGAAGLAAAVAAAREGADVLVLEADRLLGGTTAISGGVVWAPANPWATGDTPASALAYLRRLATGDVDDRLMDVFCHDAARVVAELAEHTPLEWQGLPAWPDYHSELPDGRPGGRSIWPRPLAVPADVAGRLRRPLEHTDHVLEAPADDGVVLRGPVRGHTLVAGLVLALLAMGVELRTGARVSHLVRAGDRVTGATVDGEEVRGPVILATGGFQFDRRLTATYLPAAGVVPLGTPGCVGDGLRMALAAGADLGNMTEAWWMPALHVPGETIDGEPFYRSLHSERAQPGAVLVDQDGRRFVDEAQNYGDVGRAMFRFDAAGHRWPAAPSWLVFDAAYRERFPVGPLPPGQPDPPWLLAAPTLAALAEEAGLPPAALQATIARFNEGAAAGRDPDFGRGERPYDRWIGGDPLAPVERPPFHAVRVDAGCLGTKGGPRTDDRGRVLRPDGTRIPGLYAAGNVAASPFGTATAGGGATIGPALVFGYRAGEAAVEDVCG